MAQGRMWSRRGAVLVVAGAGAGTILSSADAGAGVIRQPVSDEVVSRGALLLSEFLTAGDAGDLARQMSVLDDRAELVILSRHDTHRYLGARAISDNWNRARDGRSVSHMVSTVALRNQDGQACGECYVAESVYAADRALLLGQGHYRLGFSFSQTAQRMRLRHLSAELMWHSGQTMYWPQVETDSHK